MENKQQASTFNEELEKDYEFEIEEDKVDNGYCGSVVYGVMYKKNEDKHNGIPVALKTFNSKGMKDFDNEKQFFKDIEKSGINFNYIVKYYGTMHLNGKEYIVMEDLSVENFVTVKELFENIVLFEQHSNELKIATETLEQVKKELFETKTMVHGDLHPGNIMMNLHNSNVKLIDFGSSSIIKDTSKLSIKEQCKINNDIKNLNEAICWIRKYIPNNRVKIL